MAFLDDDASVLRKIEFLASATNKNILSDPEMEQAQNLIRDTEGVLSSLDREIELLIARRAAVAERLSRLRIAVAPHKRLPPEILAAIFARTVNDDEWLKFPPDLSQLAWALHKVCSTWRSVAVNEPSLWNRVRINTDEMGSRLVETITPLLVHHILPRSGPISISLGGNDLHAPSIIKHVVEPTLWRIKDLTLNVSLITFATFLGSLTLPHGQLCSLQSMSIETWRGRDLHDAALDVIAGDFRRAIAFQQATRLKRLDVFAHGSLSPDLFLHLPLPSAWSGLTSLRFANLCSLKISDVHRILLRCSRSLVNVSMTLSCDNDSGTEDTLDMGRAMDLPNLRSVRLNGDIEQPHSVLQIRIPWHQLTSLDIYDLWSVTLPEIHHLLCGCTQLEEFLITFQGDPEPYVECPKEMITLARLRYMKVNSYISGDLINILVLPSLETLLIRTNAMPTEEVTNMVVRSHCFLSKFGYDIPHFLDGEDAMRLLLARMPHLVEFDAPKVALDSAIMQDIAKGTLLPFVLRFSCHLTSTRSFRFFMAILERGRDQEMPLRSPGSAGALRRATGNYVLNSDAKYASRIREVVRQTKELNKVYRTMFKLVSWET